MEPSHEISNTPTLEFLYLRHSSQSVEKTLDKLKDSDVILLECVGESPESRSTLQNLINWAAKHPSQKVKERAITYLVDENEKNNFAPSIEKYVIRSGKEIIFIDAPEGHSALKDDNSANIEFESTLDTMYKGEFTKSIHHYMEYVIKKTSSDHKRNTIVNHQITEQVQSNPSLVNKRLTVIQGESHRETYRQFKKDNPQIRSTRVFDAPLIGFDIFSEIEDRIISSDWTEIPEELVKKDYISSFILYPAIADPEKKSNASKFIKLSEKICRNLSDEEVRKIFQELYKIEKYLVGKDEYFKAKHVSKWIQITGTRLLEDYKK